MAKKPEIFWVEGLLTHFEAKFPYDANDPRKMGFTVGRQIIGLYIIELLLKYALDNADKSHSHHHNLHELFRILPRPRRRAVERKYTELLNSEFERAWDVAKTADSLLKYLGRNAITDTRYYWEPNRSHLAEHASILFSPGMLRPLLYALFIVLHNYPSKPIVKRYDTVFDTLAESLMQDQERLQAEEQALPNLQRRPS